MPLPQVSDRIKELPGQALRAVFAGVGQLLLAADKVRAQLATPADEPAQPSASQASPPAAPPAASAPTTTAAPAADSGDARWRSLDKTGNVRLLPDGDEELAKAAGTPPAAAAEPAAAEAAPAPAEPEPAAVAEPEPAEVAEPAPAEPVLAEPAAEPAAAAAAEPAEVALPVANYDQLTVASLRARLRVLDTSQLNVLLDYEKAHQGRTDVVTMFERRIVKLEQGG